MRYLIAQQWGNLDENHAGYPHICKLLQEKYPAKYTFIELEPPFPIEHNFSISIIKKIVFQLDKVFIRKYYLHYLKQKCGKMLRNLSENDEVYLLEYNHGKAPQYDFAKYIRELYKNVPIYAMTHLTPSFLGANSQNSKTLIIHDRPVTKNLTLGTSLSNYLLKIGIDKNKVSTGFHAVDSDYYKKTQIKLCPRFTIIAMGGLQRNFSILSQIVKQVGDVNWKICAGRKNVTKFFEGCLNVEIKGYMPENELRDLMDNSDFSINVMDDTVGSNVITTSMAMGLGLFVSDVGSIRDYCNNDNAIFCSNTVESFVSAINSIKDDKERIYNMRIRSLELSKRFSIEETDRWFDSLIDN